MNYRIIIISMLLAAGILSCSKKQEHLPPAKMQEVLTDIHLAESYSMIVQPDSTLRKTQRNIDSLAMFYKIIFEHHHITKSQFDNSLNWYKHHPDELDSVYVKMIPFLITQDEIYQDQ